MRDLTTDGPVLRRLPEAGAVSLRAGLDDPVVAAALTDLGAPVPGPRGVVVAEERTVLWMASDELLILCDRAEQQALAARLGEALADAHHLALPVGDMRVRFVIDGPGSQVALARLLPLDFVRLKHGEVRRTHLLQIACAVWRRGSDGFEVMCFRSVADYAETALATASRHAGGVSLP